MTDTMYRRGSKEDLLKDYVIFIHSAKGINTEGAAPKIRKFAEMALRHEPVNYGDISQGVYHEKTPEAVVSKITDESEPKYTFADKERLKKVIKELTEADLGISAVVSGRVDVVDEVCRQAGIVRHSVEQGLGTLGQTDRLPSREILEIQSLCGHGMVSFNAIKKMIENVKTGRFTLDQAAKYLTMPCVCGSFNPERAKMVLDRMRVSG